MVNEKELVRKAIGNKDLITKVKNKTLHGKTVAKNPDDILDNLMSNKD